MKPAATTTLRVCALIAMGALPGCGWLVGSWAGSPQTDNPRDHLIFSHKKHVVDESVACGDCHANIKASESLTTARDIPAEKTCLECHDKADNCKQCHANPKMPATWRQDDRLGGLRFSHKAHAARALPGEATPVACDVCHGDIKDAEKASASKRPPMFAACGQCHQRDFRRDDCARCHEAGTPYGRMGSDIFDHGGGNWLRRHGTAAKGAEPVCAHCHKQDSCSECHSRSNLPLRPALQRWDRPDANAQHRGDWTTRHTIEARLDGKSCASCHEQSTCQDCHLRSGVGSIGKANLRTPHPAQWLKRGGAEFHGSAAWRDPAGCASCHDRGTASNCVDCHKVGGSGGNPHPPGWRSAADKASSPACTACH